MERIRPGIQYLLASSNSSPRERDITPWQLGMLMHTFPRAAILLRMPDSDDINNIASNKIFLQLSNYSSYLLASQCVI